VGPPEVPWVGLGFLKALRSGAISVRRVIQDYSAPTPFPYLLSFSTLSRCPCRRTFSLAMTSGMGRQKAAILHEEEDHIIYFRFLITLQ